jgi:hypothetical protein
MLQFIHNHKIMNKKNILIICIFLVLLVGIGFSYYTFNKTVPVVEIKDSLFSTYLKNKSETFTENTDWYEAKIDYPKDNQKVRDQIFEQWNNFVKENKLKDFTDAKAAREALGIQDSEITYAFSAEYKMVSSQNTISYVYDTYTFTGGAHGASNIYPITYNDKLELLSVDKLLPDDKLEKVAKLAYADILKQKKERLKSSGMSEKEIEKSLKDESWLSEGTSPTRDNYSSVWYDKEDIVINFGQYQVGPYAEGMYEVRIPFSSI